MKIWRVKPKEGGPWLIERNMADLGKVLEHMVESPGSFILERVEMSEEELTDVGEFDGW